MPPSTSTSSVGITLDVSQLALSTLLNAAQFTPVPYLVSAAGLALGLVDIIKNVKFNRDAYRRLGNDASEIVSFILRYDPRAGKEASTLPPVYLEHTKELSQTLADIYDFTKAQISRNKALCVIQSRSDTAMIQEYRERLKHSLDVFNIKCTSLMYDTIASMQGQLAGIAEHTARIPLDWRRQPESFVQEFGIDRKTQDFERVERRKPDPQKLEKEKLERERQTIYAFHHNRPRDTYTNPFRRPASMLGTPDYSFWGYSTNPFHECPGSPAFPTPFPAPPGVTMPCTPDLSAGTAFLHHNSDGYVAVPGFTVMGGDISVYANTTVNSNSGNVTVNNVTNSNNNNSYYI